jgi:hypothetical protein
MKTGLEYAASLLREAYTCGAIQPLRDWLEPTDADGLSLRFRPLDR